LRGQPRRLAELQGRKLGIKRRAQQKLGVPPLRDDAALFQHDNAVSLLHGRETVRDDQRGAVLRGIVESLLDQPLAGGIERAGCFVEQQDGRILQDRACDRNALALSTRQSHATLAEKSIVALRQFFDETGRGGHIGSPLHLRQGGIRRAVTDVVEHAPRKDHRFLQHHADFFAQFDERHVTRRDAVDQNAAGLRIVKAQQQLKQRRLAGPGRPDQRDVLTRTNIERQCGKRGNARTRRVRETDVVEADALAARRQCNRGPGLLHRRARRQQLQQTLGGAGGALQIAPYLGDRSHGAGREHRVENELGQLARRHAPGQHGLRPEPQHEHDGGEHQHDHHGGQPRACANARERGLKGCLHRAGKTPCLEGLLRIGLHGRHRIEHLARQRARVRDLVLARARKPPHAPAEDHDGRDHHDQRRDDVTGQHRARHRQHRQAAGQQKEVAQPHRQAGAHHRLDQGGVRGES
ncbi:hypothetical protein KCU90_g7146, partial [Aureobasidium melanogenum]